jgi:hypothetical protein
VTNAYAATPSKPINTTSTTTAQPAIFNNRLTQPKLRSAAAVPLHVCDARYRAQAFATGDVTLPPQREAGVAKPGPDGQNTPSGHVLHEWHLAQPLHHRVIVHDDGGWVTTD